MRDHLPPSSPSEGPSHRRIIAALLSGAGAAAAWFAATRWFGVPTDARDLTAIGAAVVLVVVVAPALRRERERRRADPPIPPGAPLYGPSFFDKTYAGTPTWIFVASAVFSGISLAVAFATLYLDVRGGRWDGLPVVLLGLAFFGVLGGLSVYGLLRRLRRR